MAAEKVEFGLGMRVLDFPDAFRNTPESLDEFLRVATEMRAHVMWTATQRELTDLDAVTMEFKAVPLKALND